MVFRIAGITAAATLFASSAFAADIITDYQPTVPVAVETAYDWSGVYLGVQGGYVWTSVDLPGGFGSEDFDGAALGGLFGWNFQQGNVVFGVEGDVSYTWNENDYGVGIGSVEIGTDWQGSVRGRLGYAFDRTLVYATGGLAITNAYIDGLGIDESETLTGWTVGGGVEHAFTNNWTARVEYRYSDYGSEDFGLGLGDFDIDEHTVRAGLSYKF
ncbi:porin family protein [Tianweitania sp. BSSL-BM11]|uniref:Porin family protein n=1 Tax=Tianweitania aestuarii TaxID=2814886 RepID=A0ABS5RUC3_9HYPH|nr:outer membrane protein [Tianweitania aestuarii]MBS9720611.1 porin family protein [Tianweitania aestuarii]